MKHRIRLVVGIALTLLIAACHAPGTADASASHDAMALKIYSVPAAQTSTLAGALQNALGKKANVAVAAPGKLLVYAPQSAQTSIGSAIATLGHGAKTEQTNEPLEIHFWIVDGEPGPGTDDPALKALEPTLDTLRKSMGPVHFNLAQALAAVADSHQQQGTIETNDGVNNQQIAFGFNSADARSTQLELQFFSSAHGGLTRLHTQVETPFGQYVVLAQAPNTCFSSSSGTTISNGKASAPPACPDQQSLRLLIVRVDRISSSA